MEIKKLQSLVIDALEDVKAQDIQLFDTTHLTSLFDRGLVTSGTSNRQTKALAAAVRDKVKENGGTVVGVEGETTGEWVLVDLGDMVVHIMQPAIRAYYRLEELWGDKPIKVAADKRVSKRTASEPEAEVKPKRAPRVGKAAPLEVSFDMMAIQTTLDDEKKPARKPRAAKALDDEKKPAARTRKTPEATAAKPKAAKIPSGGRIKVAATKSATASSKEAAAKRPSRKKASAAE